MAGDGLLKIDRQLGHKKPASTNRLTYLNTQATGAILQNKYYKNVQH
jgi:hypothetical protein|tara:strand:+ start:1697 stop:1837 length:141 start_codon:yes stop_codon:yes gene_type:complete